MLDLMERSINVAGKLVLTGDFNIRINDKNCPETNTFLDLLRCLGLINHIRFATHESASTIDLVITPSGTNYVRNSQQGRLFSDHHIVVFNVITTKGSTKGLSSIKETTYQKIKDINTAQFQTDIAKCLELYDFNSLSPDDCVQMYNQILWDALDTHAPVRSRYITVTHMKIQEFQVNLGDVVFYKN